MTILHNLWLPILASSVLVFIVSSIIHMALPWHKNDHRKTPGEDQVMDALRPFNIPPGDYMMPRCDGSAGMKSPEFAEKLKKGPVMIFTVAPNGQMRMGKCLALWFVYLFVVSYFAAYVCGHAGVGALERRQICRFAGVTAFLGYAAALWQTSIWFRRSWATTIKNTIDGIIYAAVTAATFICLWPR